MSSGARTFEAPLEEVAAAGHDSATARHVLVRPTVRGKFLFAGDEKLWVRGVTYGTFRPDTAGQLMLPPAQVRADFAAMAGAGINAVRTYTLPPRWLLDIAQEYGLRVMVGLWWDQFVTFLDEPVRARRIPDAVRDAVDRK